MFVYLFVSSDDDDSDDEFDDEFDDGDDEIYQVSGNNFSLNILN